MTVSDVAALNYRDARLRLEACGYRYVGRYYPPLDGALPGRAEQVDGLPCRRLSIDTLVLEAQSVLVGGRSAQMPQLACFKAVAAPASRR
ncbi:hypothetical protein PSQ33_006163 [Pseudomonas aeruginosa]|uniref:hypothetical protein n=1 Tax=Pseudomonas aeruginosa TaxID=287 RepID=UPI00287F4AA3|nr:hypothetical protein [Pseudomonas aeruginosa]EKL8567179.1 hypothetical protein [Pseudomonas aeruginosa]MCS7918556.1 hypothetical protein [Pseudomonas aeruginosa]HCK0579769.1 hypothetical protein [Pseudomonas aeruginosa]